MSAPSGRLLYPRRPDALLHLHFPSSPLLPSPLPLQVEGLKVELLFPIIPHVALPPSPCRWREVKAELFFCLELVRVAWGLPALVSAVASLTGVDAQLAGEVLGGLTSRGRCTSSW